MRLKNKTNIGPTSLLQILNRETRKGKTATIMNEGDGEGKKNDRKNGK